MIKFIKFFFFLLFNSQNLVLNQFECVSVASAGIEPELELSRFIIGHNARVTHSAHQRLLLPSHHFLLYYHCSLYYTPRFFVKKKTKCVVEF